MPVLRSQRSKPSKKREDEEMPPPVVTTPPRTRTRSKKVSKKQVSEIEISDEPKSPTPSSSSSRSTRTRTRSKVVPVVEEIEMASPPPPSTRSTRSTKQKATVKKTTKASAKENEKKVVTTEKPNPFVQLSPLVLAAKTNPPKPPSKNGRGRPKKAKRPLPLGESTSDDLTTEESDLEKTEKNLTLEQLHKQHLIPLNTALGMCDNLPKCTAKLMDDTAARKQEKEFQRLLNETEMPPPPPPKTKGKGRHKRARSPENVPTSATTVPESFNFNDAETHVQANKKIIMDPPTPDKDEASNLGEEKATDTKTSTANDEMMIVDQPIPPTAEKKEAPSVTLEKATDSTKSTIKKDKVIMDQPTPDKIETSTATEKEATEKANATANNVLDKTRSISPKTHDAVTKTIVPCEDLNSTYVLPTAKKATSSAKMNTNVAVTAKKATSSSMMNVTVCFKKDSTPEVEVPLKEETQLLKPVTAPSSAFLPEDSIIIQESPASSTFVKEKEEASKVKDEEATDSTKSTAKDDELIVDQSTPDKEASGANVTDKEATERTKSPVVDVFDKTRSISPNHHETVAKPNVPCNDLNSTYVLPTAKKPSSKKKMNVTVVVKKDSAPELEVSLKEEAQLLKPVVAPSTVLQQGSRFMTDSPASRTFVKEPPSLAVVVEEDDDGKESVKSEKKSENKLPQVSAVKPVQKEKEKPKEKTVSTSSSSSSNSSMKSASSQPCLLTNKKLPTSAIKNGTNYGSTGKLHEVLKSKPLEEAEKRRLEILQQKQESFKKKNAEWSKKTEKVKLLEEEKKLKEKQKVAPPAVSVPQISSILKKPVPMAFGKAPAEGAPGGLGYTKPKFNFGPSTKMAGHAMPPLSKTPFHKPANPPPPTEVDMDDSFKSATNASSFLDQTTEGHLSSYDITMYEDLDEDLKHRENKTVPNWASDKEALKVALFSMVLLPEYENKFYGGFPKQDKSYKLFPNRHI